MKRILPLVTMVVGLGAGWALHGAIEKPSANRTVTAEERARVEAALRGDSKLQAMLREAERLSAAAPMLSSETVDR